MWAYIFIEDVSKHTYTFYWYYYQKNNYFNCYFTLYDILQVKLPGSVTTVSQDTPLKPSGHVQIHWALTYPPFWHTGGDVQDATKVTTSSDILHLTHIPPFWLLMSLKIICSIWTVLFVKTILNHDKTQAWIWFADICRRMN